MKKSSSNSDLSKHSTPRVKPDTPKLRSKSRPQDRQYTLWMPESLSNLEDIIQAKQRTLDLLNYQTETLEKDMQEQLLTRDKYISELNRSILDVRCSLKPKDIGKNEKSVAKELQDQEKSISDNRRENEELVSKIREIENKFEKMIRKWDEEKENLEILKNALAEEKEGYCDGLTKKENEVAELVQGIQILQSAVERLTKLNSELFNNFDKVSTDILASNIKYYEANIKGSGVNVLEETLQESINRNHELEVKGIKLKSYVDSLARFTKVTDWVAENIKNIEDFTRNREESLSTITEAHIEKELQDIRLFLSDTINNLSTIKSSLVTNTPKVNPEDESTEETLRKRYTVLEEQVKNKLQSSKDYKLKESDLLQDIAALKISLEKGSLDYKSQASKMKGQIDLMNDTIEKFNERVHNFNTENEKYISELYTTRAKLLHLNNSQDMFQKKRKDFKEYGEKLKAENTQLKNRLMAFDSVRKQTSKATLTEEVKVKKSISQLPILRDEIFRKDTEILRKLREMTRLENELERQKGMIEKIYERMKNIETEVIGKVSHELEEKDRQIEILKEMLRCAHSDIKSKDSQLNSIKPADRMTSPRRK